MERLELNNDVLSHVPKSVLIPALGDRTSGKFKTTVKILSSLTGEAELTVKAFLDGINYDLSPKAFSGKADISMQFRD